MVVTPLHPGAYFAKRRVQDWWFSEDAPAGTVPPMRRTFVLLGLLLILSSPAVAEDGWLEDTLAGCKLWVRNLEPGDAVVWNGPCKDGLAEGRGTYQFTLNDTPTWKGEAEFKQGKREGQGSAQNADGTKLEGTYKDGVLNGRVIETDGARGRYVGTYRNGERNGTGRYTYRNGDYCEGEFRNGAPHGKGTFHGHNQIGGVSVYTGVWRDGCLGDGDRKAAVLRTRKECGFD